MKVKGCKLADTKGARKCPYCGERHLQKIHSVDSTGRPLKVECPVCRMEWQWPTVAEDELRRKEQMRQRSHDHYWNNKERYQQYWRENQDRITAKAKERRHRQRAHLHPIKTCPTCGFQFVALHGGHKYCSEHCARNSPDRKRAAGRQKDRAKRRNDAYLAALEAVAREVGRLDECIQAKEDA